MTPSPDSGAIVTPAAALHSGGRAAWFGACAMILVGAATGALLGLTDAPRLFGLAVALLAVAALPQLIHVLPVALPTAITIMIGPAGTLWRLAIAGMAVVAWADTVRQPVAIAVVAGVAAATLTELTLRIIALPKGSARA